MNSSTTKQKLVIVLYGFYNSGKTTTLNILIQRLLETKDSSLLVEDRKNLRGEDRRVLISYQDKKVYVATPGDVEKVTEESVKRFRENDYDILVTAARSSGNTHAPIDKYVLDHGVQIERVEKKRVDEDRDEADRAKAQDIKDIIDAFIKEHL